jgi:hypothetical protein
VTALVDTGEVKRNVALLVEKEMNPMRNPVKFRLLLLALAGLVAISPAKADRGGGEGGGSGTSTMVDPSGSAYKQKSQGGAGNSIMVGPSGAAYKQKTPSLSHSEAPASGAPHPN